MITAEEANALAAPRRRPQDEMPTLTSDEAIACNFIDFKIESGIFAQFRGEPFEVTVPAEVAKSLDVMKALKRRYEDGRWLVAVEPLPNATGDMVQAFRMIFAPKQVEVATSETPTALPLVIPSFVADHPAPSARLLVRMPTRARWPQALSVIAAYRSMAGMPITIEVVVDYDDDTLTSQVLYRLAALDCIVTYGHHKSKIEACNGGRFADWDILVLASDDMVPRVTGWAKRVVYSMGQYWPHFDGALHFNDGNPNSINRCTLPVMGRRLYEQFGYVYHPSYKSLFCDDEYTAVLNSMMRQPYLDDVLIEHMHPAAGKAKVDALYVKNDALLEADKETFQWRQEQGLTRRAMMLSILVASLPERHAMRCRLVDFLYSQIERFRTVYSNAMAPLSVEIVVDDRPGNIGEKRQRLIDRAVGKFLCFVDDDDWVDAKYIERLTTALESDPLADCVSLVGEMTTNGNHPERFEHSLKYDAWSTMNGVHIRPPNHLNVVRTALARQVGFKSMTYGEDRNFSDRLRPLLHREVSTGDRPLYYYWYRDK